MTWKIGFAIILASMIGCSDDDIVAPTPTPPEPLRFDDFQAADVVIGQVDMASGEINAGIRDADDVSIPHGGGLRQPFGSPAFGNGTLYVADSSNRRVLAYNMIPATNGAIADFAIGQPDLESGSGGTSASKMIGPVSCRASGGKLFVTDHNNNRLLIWNRLPTSDVPADVVVGQTSFSGRVAAAGAAGLNNPRGLAVVGGKLFVADFSNSRVLMWNRIPVTHGTPADLVIGQSNFDTVDPGLSATALSGPWSIWTDGKKLAVTDTGNHRVLIWNSIPTENGEPADVVIGAPNFLTDGLTAPTATSVGSPAGIASDGTSLFICDGDNHRVLIFPFPTANGAPATGVLGQSSFSLGEGNDPNQDGVSEFVISARTFLSPFAVRVVGRRLLVTDFSNSRLLIFNSK